MCGSRKYPYPPHRWSLEIPKELGGPKANIFKGKYEAKLEFPEGWGSGGGASKQKNIHGGGMDILWNNTMLKCFACLE